MLRIRLARTGKNKKPFFRVVLTEHTKPVQSWFKTILWWYDPLKHETNIKEQECKKWIEYWAKPSEKVAKLLFQQTNDDYFKKFCVERHSNKKAKKEKK